MLKKIALALIAAVGGFAAVVAMQPSHYQVERTASIAAPAAAVFPQINDLHKWDGWSPWAKLDPNAKVSFEGPEQGHGAVLKWAGNAEVGEGQMTVTHSHPSQHVGIKVDMVKPFKGSSKSDFDLKPDGNATAVTWRMSGKHGFFGKAMCLVMNGNKMLGQEIEKGLNNLKAAAEGAAKP